MVLRAWVGDELWCGQAQNGVNFEFQVKFDIEGQGRSLHKKIGSLTKVFYTSDTNLFILARMGHELFRGQAIDTHTDTHKRTQATTIPGLILDLRPANERRRYFVTTSLIGWAQA